jgi:hypothetical protein
MTINIHPVFPGLPISPDTIRTAMCYNDDICPPISTIRKMLVCNGHICHADSHLPVSFFKNTQIQQNKTKPNQKTPNKINLIFVKNIAKNIWQNQMNKSNHT